MDMINDFDDWWRKKTNGGDGERLAEYLLVREAYLDGCLRGYRDGVRDSVKWRLTYKVYDENHGK